MDIKLKSTLEYKNMTIFEIYKYLNTDKDGLTENEALKRINIYGYNEIKEKKENKIVNFLKRYIGIMPLLLEFAIVLTCIIKHYLEAVIIFILLNINAIIGYIQSQNSQKALELLKNRLNIKSKILRENKSVLKTAKYIVPGDIIILKLGDLVPADVYIISGNASVDESAITGESMTKFLKNSDIVYSGSIIKQGEIKAIVINTGKNTYFGKTAELVEIAKVKSEQEKIMLNITKYMVYLGLIASFIVAIYSIILHKEIVDILTFIVTLLIGTIPVALPAVLTIVQAYGALELSKKGVLVTRLSSIEDASLIDLFCFDKTGTITLNKLGVTDVLTYNGYSKQEALKIAASASNQNQIDGIDNTLIESYNELNKDKLIKSLYQQISYVPFNPKDRKTSATIVINGKNTIAIKGAYDTITMMCNISDDDKKKYDSDIDKLSSKGYRTIAIALSEEDKNFKIIAIIAFSDPARPDSKEMIAKIKDLGIKTLMITGDSLPIAKQIASEVGIGINILTISDLKNKNEKEQYDILQNCDGFAQVYPEDKYNIVKLFQKNSHSVGMTGDGVNDAPALKQAQLGVAVDGATDVAKSAASIVITKPGLSAIISAIDISRKTYQRMLTWVLNKITKVTEFIIILLAGFFVFHKSLLSLLGAALLVFVNDFVTMSIATDNATESKNPNRWEIKKISIVSTILGIMFAIIDLIIIYVGVNIFDLSFEKLQTLTLISLIFNSQLRIILLRQRNHFYESKPSNLIIILFLLTITVFIIISIFGILVSPLSLTQVLVTLLMLIFTDLLIIDNVKLDLFKKYNI